MNEPKRGPLGKPEAQQVARLLAERLSKHVGLEVWTRSGASIALPDRDDARHAADLVALVRQLASLHPALTLTPYDIEKHAEQAKRAGVSLVPATVVRGSGRAVQCVGLFSGLLFPPFLDLLWFASTGGSPLSPESRETLQAIDRPVEIEAFLAAYDGFSAHLMSLLCAVAMETRQVRLRLIEAAEFPVLAGQRLVTEVPLLLINGRRFTGLWTEADLLEQVRRVLVGDDDPVIRPRVLATEYVSEDEAKRIVAERQAAEQPGPAGSGLVLPGDRG